MGTDLFPIPWGMLSYDTEENGYLVKLDRSTIEGAPKYSAENRPSYDETYVKGVHEFYGIFGTPADT